MNCRIVGAICQHQLLRPKQFVSFQRKEAHYLKNNEKMVT